MLSNFEIIESVDEEGIGETILSLPPSDVSDPTLKALWVKAQDAIYSISSYLAPFQTSGEADEEDEDEDDDEPEWLDAYEDDDTEEDEDPD